MFAGFILLIAILHRVASAPQTLGDTLIKSHAQGGFAFGRITASLAIAAAMMLLIVAAPSVRRPAIATTRD